MWPEDPDAAAAVGGSLPAATAAPLYSMMLTGAEASIGIRDGLRKPVREVPNLHPFTTALEFESLLRYSDVVNGKLAMTEPSNRCSRQTVIAPPTARTSRNSNRAVPLVIRIWRNFRLNAQIHSLPNRMQTQVGGPTAAVAAFS